MANETPEAGWRRFVMVANAATTGFQPAPLATTVAPTMLPGAPHISPSNDVIELLPEERKDLLRKLRQHREDSHRLIPVFETIREASMKKIDAANSLKRLTSHAQDGGFGLKPDDRRVIEAQRHLDKVTADFQRLQELQEVRSAAFQTASGALAAVETWLRDGRPGNTQLEAVETEVPKLAKGETLLDCVERLRRDGRRIKADIHRVRSACYTKAEAMALVSATVENWGSNGIDTSATIEHLSQPTIPTKTVKATVHNVPGAPAAVVYVEVPDLLAIFSTVLKDQFIAWLAADVDRNADPEGALSREAREQQEAELASDLLSTERDESAAVWLAMEQNLPVQFRPDIDPRALLSVRCVVVPRANPPPSSPPHEGYDLAGRR